MPEAENEYLNDTNKSLGCQKVIEQRKDLTKLRKTRKFSGSEISIFPTKNAPFHNSTRRNHARLDG
ncbi:hypothetical protein A3C09_03930 [Candidatus Uhrbacteria bacterium RIFCSPHIGHO2_02_FULL_47_44]|uniref:Uncharacterized protein n=1 Tax=Candidatus Uhrbacteria bacterium RIFCSPLOWO2_02_FULL_48_18 TaxID=1802408 RepID=A0A1F7VDK9_9BACT|nr:MAG: hypothetical protein A2839_01935 [Candidatus Uhrbacteria bacterium RIFCSPHIGHO2_01_FULL_47_10]OGL71827.1 MAG: hypothetical protein A3C09_03930 [Candidatus Uhrbacteria bacterium RIFCSPHIGHO2_02_FULL_47_44]OGL77052.1 MAG: hypothetical protein A3E97_01475 [Candidatus Uhrbacteria bacterium RIFCSPHIGHO2_12_FULL_47_12]OGL80599.1 MAG: hypothetical protein A3B20_04355 [Candidatus Uhrbacteria bacterium RIFCSPLOWO2_01_FULL_47_17]OGL88218.1 MAG: hypothetical protein A3I41_00625 [Candidatus Uhrbact